MNSRTGAQLGLGIALLVAGGCGTTTSPTPFPAAQTVALTESSYARANANSANHRVFGLGAADLASCLGSAGGRECFSGAALGTLAIAAAATAPGAPGTPTATVNGNAITLAWSAPTSGDPVVSYVLEAGSSSGSSNLANIATNSTAPTFSTTGVPAGTYYVRGRKMPAD